MEDVSPALSVDAGPGRELRKVHDNLHGHPLAVLLHRGQAAEANRLCLCDDADHHARAASHGNIPRTEAVLRQEHHDHLLDGDHHVGSADGRYPDKLHQDSQERQKSGKFSLLTRLQYSRYPSRNQSQAPIPYRG